MDVTTKTQQLLNDMVTQSSKTLPSPNAQRDTTLKDIQKLEGQLNKHLKDKQGQRFQKVSITNVDNDKVYNEKTMNTMLDNEISTKYATKRWNSIPMYMKWNLIQTYLDENEITTSAIKTFLKNAINKNKLDINVITFDHINHKITDINLEFLQQAPKI